MLSVSEILVDHCHVDMARLAAMNLDRAHGLIEPEIRLGEITVEAPIHREKVLLLPSRRRSLTGLVRHGHEFRLAQHVREMEFQTPDYVVSSGQNVFEYGFDAQRVAELNGIVDAEHVPVQTGPVNDRSVDSVSIERPAIGVSERDAMALEQLAIDKLRPARIVVTVDE